MLLSDDVIVVTEGAHSLWEGIVLNKIITRTIELYYDI